MKDITGTYRVLAKPSPFKDEVLETTAGVKLSLRDVLGNSSNDYIISINGDIIECEDWALVYPHEDDVVIITRLPKGDGRDIARLVAAIAVLAFAAWAGPVLAGISWLPGTAAFWTSATMFFGMVAIGLLLPPKMPDTALEETKRLNSLTGTRNRFAPYAPIPNVYGKHKLFPPIASLPYTEVIGEDQYLNMVFCVGLGSYTIDPASVKIGDTPATSFEDIEIFETDQPQQPDIFELQQNLVLNQPAEPGDTFTRTTAANTEDISLDFVLPAGLIQVDPDDGDRHYIRLHFSVEFRASGSSDPWTHVTSTAWNQRTRGIREVLGLPADDNPTELTSSAGAIRVSTANSNWLMIEARTRDPFRVGVKFSPGGSGTWDVRVTRQQSQLDTRTSRTEADDTWEEFSSTFVWTALRSFNNTTQAVTLPANTATFLTVRIRATDQLNGIIDTLSCIAQRELRSWNKVGQSFNAPAVTRNPAWAYLDILTGLGNARPTSTSQIDLDSIADWAAVNATENFYYDEVIDYSTSVFDALTRACGVGRAALSNRDGLWTVILEQAGGSPVQLFTPRNSWGFTGSKRFVNFPHALKVRFNSEDSDYQEDEMMVYDDGYNSGNATEFEVMELPGITDSDQAWRVGRFTIASLRLRPEIYTFYADIEHIVAQRGDHILMTHDIPLWGTGFGRIVNISGNQVTLDTSMFIDIGKSYRMRVRKSNGTTVIEDLINQGGDVTTHTFTPSIPSGLNVGDLAIVGELNKETTELVVIAIEPASELTAKITCVDHNDAILTADTGPIPPFNPNITLPPDPRTMTPLPPFNVQATSDQLNFVTDGNNVIQPRIVVTWDIDSTAVNRWSSLSADLRYREWDVALNGGTWNYIRSFNAFQAFINIDNVDIGNEYEIQMRTVSPFGTPSPWTASILHTVGGGTRLPPSIDSLTTIPDFGAIIVRIDYTTVTTRQGSYLEILHNTVNNRDDVNTITVVKTVPNDLTLVEIVDYYIPFADTSEHFFWARIVDIYGTASEYFPILATDGVSGTPLASESQFYYIKPTQGTAIKNSTGQLTVEARVVNGALDTLLSSGTIQLYDPSDLVVTFANGYVTGSDGYTGILDAEDINNSKVITLKDGPAGAPIDTITLVDILDGQVGLDGVYGYIEADPGIAWVRDKDGVTWDPAVTSTQLNVTFVQGGSAIARWARTVSRDADGILTDGGAATHPLGDLNTVNITPTITGASSRALTVAFAYSDATYNVTVAETVVTARSGENPLVYYIKPLNGTAIKNSTGQLTVEAHRIDDTGDNLISSGTIQLYDPSNNIVNFANGYVVGSDGYTGILDAGDILGDIVITLKDGIVGEALDTITLVDITDGLDTLVGYIEPTNGLAWVKNGTTGQWTPSSNTTDLACTFNKAGVDVARIAYRITLNQENGQLTGSTVAHPLGDLNVSRVTITPSGLGTYTVTVKFEYDFEGFTATVSETVGAVLPVGELPLIVDPDFNLGGPFGGGVSSDYWLAVEKTGGGGASRTALITYNATGGNNGDPSLTWRPSYIIGGPGTGQNVGVESRQRFRAATASLEVRIRYKLGTAITASGLTKGLRVQFDGYSAREGGSFITNSTLELKSLPASASYTTARFVVDIPSVANAQWWNIDVVLVGNFITDPVLEVDSIYVFSSTGAAGNIDGNNKLVPGLVPEADQDTDANRFLRGDGTWADVAAAGGVTVSGTPVDNQIAVWDTESSVEGDPGLTYDTALAALSVTDHLRLAERATGPSSIITKGLLWLRSDTPNTLVFTDDAGNEFDIGGSTVGGVDSVTAGQGLTQNFTTGDVTLNVGVGTGLSVAADSIGLDFSALSEKTGDLVGTDRIAISSAGVEYCETISGIPLSIFNNDAGFTTGGITAVGTPVDNQIAVWTGASTIEGDTELTFDTASNVLSIGTDGSLRLDERTAGPAGIISKGHLWVRGDTPNTLMFTDDAGTEFAIGGSTVGRVDSLTAGQGLTSNGTTGDITINVGVGTGLSVAADSVGLDFSALSEKTGNLVGTDRIAISSGGVEYCETISGIPLSIFNNDAGFLTSGVNISGTPANNQIAVWTGADTIEGDSGLIFDTVTNVLAIDGDGSIRLDERATGPAGIISKGHLWVRSDAPNTLIFTDDAGTDFPIGGSTVGRVDSLTAGQGLTSNGTTGDITINVGVGTGLSVAADSIGLDFSALSEKSGALVGTDRIAIATSGGAEYAETISGIPLSIFNNDAGFSTGGVNISGTPSNNQIGVWTNSNTMEGDADLLYDTVLNVLALENNGSIRIDERGTGPGQTTAKGHLWVRNDTPNTLMFTDDAGNEFAVGGSTVGGVDSVTAGQGLTQNSTTGAVTINVGVGAGLSVAADSIGLDANSLAASGTLVGTDDLVSIDGTVTRKTQISTIPLSIFNNDAGFSTGGVSISGTPSNNQLAVWTNASTIEGDSGIQFDTTNNKFILDGDPSIRLDERATGPGGTTAKGHIWVKNTAPNVLMFTDDAGNDVEVGGASVGVTSITAGNGLTQNSTTGAVTINVGVGTGLSAAADSIGLNYSALSEKSGALVGTDRIAIATSGGAENCETISGIPLSIFNNDAFVEHTAGGSVQLATQSNTATGNTTGATVRRHTGGATGGNQYDVGMNILPLGASNTSINPLPAHLCGAVMYTNNSTNYTWTLPTSSQLDFPVYGVCTFINHSDSNKTIARGTSNLYWQDGSSGVKNANRTLGPRGVATVWRYSAGNYFIWGIGLS